ncbi:protein of unassigned function [Methylobacterium oryzae CBMB20]|uniref:Protein of unassigned function n=1 Tax=Methylobacterium oryzae CBMB20 TaxID=693986 RepID=A0A089NLB7_9HYPH|nr:protein of unassigned function [Methylobacterium oryzae CBMB20]
MSAFIANISIAKQRRSEINRHFTSNDPDNSAPHSGKLRCRLFIHRIGIDR